MFDPYGIYKRQVHSSHSGQVIRKKIRRKYGKVYSKEELEDAIPALKAIGYSVQKGSFYSTQITTWSDTYMLDTGSLTFNDDDPPSPLLFSTIWSDIKADFQDCLAIDPISVVNILFEIDLISIDLHGTYQGSRNTYPYLHVYMDDSSKFLTNITYSQTIPSSGQSSNFHVSWRSFSNSQVYITQSGQSTTGGWGQEAFRDKKEFLDSVYLNIIERRQPAIITALRNDDYDTFDPALFYISMPDLNQTPATISNSFITIQVKMIIEHK